MGTSHNSKILSVTAGLKPFQMRSPSFSSFTMKSVSLSWSLIEGIRTGGTTSNPITISNIIIYQKSVSTIFIPIYQASATESSYIVSGLVSGITYEYQL